MTTDAGKELDGMMTDIIRDHEMTHHPFVQCPEVDGRCAVVVAKEQAAEIEHLCGEVLRRDGWRKAKDAEHGMHARGWQQQIRTLEARLASVLDGSTLARVEALHREASQTDEEPADGTLVQVDERWVYVRTDREAGQRFGDWWPVEADPEDAAVHPITFGEMLGFDEPPEDRVRRNVEVLIPASDLGLALRPPREG